MTQELASSGPAPIQRLALDEELLTAIRLISGGLGQLQRLDGANDFYHLPFLSLSGGFERLVKVMICLDALERTGQFPSSGAAFRGRQGHDLEELLRRILNECFNADYLAKIPVAQQDFAYLGSDELLEFVRVLSRFGQAARYHDLDVVLGTNPPTDSPKHEWESLEVKILFGNDRWKDEFIADPASREIHDRVTREVVIRLERFARALARLFTIGRLGKEAQRFTGHIGTFLYLSDSELGTREYSPLGVLR